MHFCYCHNNKKYIYKLLLYANKTVVAYLQFNETFVIY